MTPDGAAKPPEKGPKARLVSIDQLDRRSKAAQLALKAKNDILADLGGESELSTIERLLCDHASLASPVVARLRPMAGWGANPASRIGNRSERLSPHCRDARPWTPVKGHNEINRRIFGGSKCQGSGPGRDRISPARRRVSQSIGSTSRLNPLVDAWRA